jgi:hypothetical protein
MAAKHLGGAWPQKGLGPERRRAGQRRGLPGTMRGFLWPAEFLVFSDFLVADPHAHSALHWLLPLTPRFQFRPVSVRAGLLPRDPRDELRAPRVQARAQ